MLIAKALAASEEVQKLTDVAVEAQAMNSNSDVLVFVGWIFFFLFVFPIIAAVILKNINSGFKRHGLKSPKKMFEGMFKQIGEVKIVGVLLLISAIACFGMAYDQGENILHLSLTGRVTEGEVVDIRQMIKQSGRGSGRGRRHHSSRELNHAVVKFYDGRGQEYSLLDDIGRSQFLPSVRGKTVEVLYDPLDPNNAIVDRGLWNWFVSGGFTFGALFCLFGAMVALRGDWKYDGKGFKKRKHKKDKYKKDYKKKYKKRM